MSINKKFEDIVDFCLIDVDELGDDIILEEDVFKPRGKMYIDQATSFSISIWLYGYKFSVSIF